MPLLALTDGNITSPVAYRMDGIGIKSKLFWVIFL